VITITYKDVGGQYQGSGINTQDRRFSVLSIARLHDSEGKDFSTAPENRSDRYRGSQNPQPSQRSAIATKTESTE
jgi:hypothetical protein